MAYAALVSLAQILDQLLNHASYSISLYEKQHITSLHKHIILLQDFLQDFPDKAQCLEGQIRDLSNEAEDAIEYFMWEQFRAHSGHYQVRQQLGYHFHLRKVIEKIEPIAQQVMKIKTSFKINEAQQLGDSPASRSASRPVHAHKDGDSPAATSASRSADTHKDVMIGFENNLTEIKARLCGDSPHLQIIPIVGMGGIGKTTLVRNAFDDPLIMEYFIIRVWVTVSQDYCAEEILSSLLESIDESNKEKSGQKDELVDEKVYKSLKGRRYLIVMDDMWSTKTWNDLRTIFPDDGNGSRIMLTTRLADVAAYPDPRTPLHKMRFMDVDQSWYLLRHKVFGHQDCPPELETTGKEIARSCRGLPLAIVVVGGLLSVVSKTLASWGGIAENVNSTVATKDGHCEKILSLSYTHLPHHLRPCFLYMGSYPEDYEIRVSKLVKLWVAEGFLKRKDGSRSLEEEAEEYVEDLVKRSLIFVSKRKSNGKIKSCSVHDIVRDLCIRIGQEEKFLIYAENTLPKSLENQCRISVANYGKDCLAVADNCGSTVRTIKCFHCKRIATDSLGNYKLLRVLVAVYTKFVRPTHDSVYFSAQVSQMFRLRHLDLYYENDLPEAISNLQNLQTLIIHAWKTSRDYPHQRVNLPLGIWRMPQLRHLISYFFGAFLSPNSALENLQTLSLVTNLRCTKTVLEKIPNLKKLGIFYYRDQSGVRYYYHDYHLEDLLYLHKLEKLKIKIYADFPHREKLNPVFPTTLKKLTLSGRRLPWEGITIIGSLPHLEVLKLRDFACRGSTWETIEGEFPQLKFLLIDKSDLQHWITESSHFPRLNSLVLHRCWCLTQIPDGIGEIPTLELIEVDNGKKSLVESAKRIQKEQQEDWGNDGLQVRILHL